MAMRVRAGTRYLTAGVAASLASTLVLAACGGGSAKPKHSPSPTRTVKQHVTSSTNARRALLTTADVGSLLKPVPFHKPTTPLFCRPRGAPTVFSETKAVDVVGSRFTSDDPKADLTEEVYLYKTAADARAALDMVQGDMDCASGFTYNSDGTSDAMGVGASTDYSTQLTADFAFGWTLRTKDTRGLELAVPAGTALLLFRYTAGLKANTDKLPDAFDLATTAYNRLSRA